MSALYDTYIGRTRKTGAYLLFYKSFSDVVTLAQEGGIADLVLFLLYF